MNEYVRLLPDQFGVNHSAEEIIPEDNLEFYTILNPTEQPPQQHNAMCLWIDRDILKFLKNIEHDYLCKPNMSESKLTIIMSEEDALAFRLRFL